MARIDTTQPQESQGQQYDILPTDVYRMKIVESKREASSFADDNGEFPIKLVVIWEVSGLLPEQDEDEVTIGTRVYQRFNPWYGTTKTGASSKYKEFVDTLLNQGLIEPEFDDEEDLVDIEQRVSIEKYAKTMGANKGQPGNRVVSVMPLRAKKAKAQPASQPVAAGVEDDEIPF